MGGVHFGWASFLSGGCPYQGGASILMGGGQKNNGMGATCPTHAPSHYGKPWTVSMCVIWTLLYPLSSVVNNEIFSELCGQQWDVLSRSWSRGLSDYETQKPSTNQSEINRIKIFRIILHLRHYIQTTTSFCLRNKTWESF